MPSRQEGRSANKKQISRRIPRSRPARSCEQSGCILLIASCKACLQNTYAYGCFLIRFGACIRHFYLAVRGGKHQYSQLAVDVNIQPTSSTQLGRLAAVQ